MQPISIEHSLSKEFFLHSAKEKHATNSKPIHMARFTKINQKQIIARNSNNCACTWNSLARTYNGLESIKFHSVAIYSKDKKLIMLSFVLIITYLMIGRKM